MRNCHFPASFILQLTLLYTVLTIILHTVLYITLQTPAVVSLSWGKWGLPGTGEQTLTLALVKNLGVAGNNLTSKVENRFTYFLCGIESLHYRNYTNKIIAIKKISLLKKTYWEFISLDGDKK